LGKPVGAPSQRQLARRSHHMVKSMTVLCKPRRAFVNAGLGLNDAFFHRAPMGLYPFQN
jgi:hypothetical protein